MKNYGKEEEHVLEAENKKLEEDKEKLETELKKASDGNVIYACTKVEVSYFMLLNFTAFAKAKPVATCSSG